jgi:hypothetical protein
MVNRVVWSGGCTGHVCFQTTASGCDFNRSMQHLSSSDRAEDVADEAKTEDLLHTRTERADVGSLAGW